MSYLPADNRYATMKYNRCGKSGLLLPALSMGLWHNFGAIDDYENARDILQVAFDNGITHFDLANNYGPPAGSAETTFGKIFKQDFLPFRDELIIATKAGWGMWPGPYGDGGSPCLIHQPKYSMFDREVENGLLDVLAENGVGCIPFSPLAQGLLSNKYLAGIPANSRAASQRGNGAIQENQLAPEKIEKARQLNILATERGQNLAQMALSWVLKDDRITSVLLGASKPGQVLDSIKCLDNSSFSEEEIIKINYILS